MNMMTSDMMAQAELLISGAVLDGAETSAAVRPTPPNWLIAPVFRPQPTHDPVTVARAQAVFAAKEAPYRSLREVPRAF